MYLSFICVCVCVTTYVHLTQNKYWWYQKLSIFYFTKCGAIWGFYTSMDVMVSFSNFIQEVGPETLWTFIDFMCSHFPIDMRNSNWKVTLVAIINTLISPQTSWTFVDFMCSHFPRAMRKANWKVTPVAINYALTSPHCLCHHSSKNTSYQK